MASIAVPGASSAVEVLSIIWGLCGDVQGGKQSCELLHERLSLILKEMERLATEGRTPRDVVTKFVASLTRLWTDIAPYKDLPFFERVFRFENLKKTITDVNEEVDTMFRMLNLVASGSLTNWRRQLETDANLQRELTMQVFQSSIAILDQVKGLKAQVDTLLILKCEVDKIEAGTSDQPEDVQKGIKKSMRVIQSSSRAEVPRVPKWFIAEVNISYEPKEFSRGAFGSVHHGTYNGAKVVIKMLLPGEGGLDKQMQADFVKEADRWFAFNHPHVIKMFGASAISKRPFIVCENADHGNFADYLEDHKHQMWQLLHQAALGLLYLHKNGVIHGDLKLNNMLVGTDRLARLADFGLSRVKTGSKSKMSTLASGKQVEGGLHWLAPERFEYEAQPASDVHALAMCFIEAASGDAPYGSLDSISVRAKIKAGELPKRPASLSDDAWNLVGEMTVMDPFARLPLEDVIQRLQRFAEIEATEYSDSDPYCEVCYKTQPRKAKFCNDCGRSLTGEESFQPAQSPKPRAIKDLVADLNNNSVEKQTKAAMLLYRRAADPSACAEIKLVGGLDLLLTAVKKTEHPTQALYAFGCLELLHAAGQGPTEQELAATQAQAYEDIDGSATEELATQLEELLSSDDATKRDERQGAELAELVVRLGTANQNAVANTISGLVRVLQESSGELRDAALAAVAALAEGHTNNLRSLRLEGIELVVLDLLATGVGQSRQHAADLLAGLTENSSSATKCATARGIRTIIGVLEDDGADVVQRKEPLLRIIGHLAKLSSTKQLLGANGAVYSLANRLLSGESPETQKRLAFSALALLVSDPMNGLMFQQAGAMAGVKELLRSNPDDALLGDLATLVENATLRDVVAADADMLGYCLAQAELRSTGATRVLGELVRGNVAVYRAIKERKGLLKKLVQRNDDLAVAAVLNLIETLEAAPPQQGPLAAPQEPISGALGA